MLYYTYRYINPENKEERNMKKLRYLIAAALAAGSMAVCAGAVRTVTPQEALQSSIAQVQQQWQNENDKSMYFIDGDG